MGNREEAQLQHQELADAILASMETDGLHWTKGWSVFPPENGAKGNRYNGINRMYLTWTAIRRGYDDPRWCTFKQATAKGWNMKGQKAAAKVEFWDRKLKDKKDENGNIIYDEDGNPKKEPYFIIKLYHVFNLGNIEDAPKFLPELQAPEGDYTLADFLEESYFKKNGIWYKELWTVEQAAYAPFSDTVMMPKREAFMTSEQFLSTLAHEAIHSTGRKDRCDRKSSSLFGSESYAFEELVAELGGMFLCQDFGIKYDPDTDKMESHAAYLQHWKSHLSDKKTGGEWMASAIKKALKAVTFIEGKAPEDEE